MSAITNFHSNTTMGHPVVALGGRQAGAKIDELDSKTGVTEHWQASGELAEPAIASLEQEVGEGRSMTDEYQGMLPDPEQAGGNDGLGNAPCGHSFSEALGKLKSFGGSAFSQFERHLQSQVDSRGSLDIKG